jgi:CMP-N-acetylneuraminic acid synthetase
MITGETENKQKVFELSNYKIRQQTLKDTYEQNKGNYFKYVK